MNRKLMLAGFIIFALAALALVILAVVLDQDREAGAIQFAEREVYWPSYSPLTLVSDETVPVTVIARGLEPWREWIPELDISIIEDPETYFEFSEAPIEERMGIVLLTADNLDSEEIGGRTTVHFPRDGSDVVAASIVLNDFLVVSPSLFAAALTHELGHVLGLDDDEPPCFSSNSIMCRKLLPNGTLTRHDRLLLRKRWGQKDGTHTPTSTVGTPPHLRYFAPQSHGEA